MSTLHIPSSCPAEEILMRTTHLGIGAHQDDLEFMAYHGIATCYDSDRNWFTGVTCTSGGGSSRSGPFANHSDEEIIIPSTSIPATSQSFPRHCKHYAPFHLRFIPSPFSAVRSGGI